MLSHFVWPEESVFRCINVSHLIGGQPPTVLSFTVQKDKNKKNKRLPSQTERDTCALAHVVGGRGHDELMWLQLSSWDWSLKKTACN